MRRNLTRNVDILAPSAIRIHANCHFFSSSPWLGIRRYYLISKLGSASFSTPVESATRQRTEQIGRSSAPQCASGGALLTVRQFTNTIDTANLRSLSISFPADHKAY